MMNLAMANQVLQQDARRAEAMESFLKGSGRFASYIDLIEPF